MEPKNIFFILVRPLFLGNIGSVARVLKNFGFENLRLVAPPRNYKDAEARRMAVGAFDLLKTSQVYGDLSEAIKDIDLAVGTTCGYQRSCQPVPLNEIGSQLGASSRKRIAIIFGEERDGMTRQELECCQHIVTIPTAPTFPSLNIAQAVGIFAYELSRPAAGSPADLQELASGVESDEFFTSAESLLHEVGFTRNFNQKSIMTEFRSLFQRAKPSPRELRLLQGALRRLEQRILMAPAGERQPVPKDVSEE